MCPTKSDCSNLPKLLLKTHVKSLGYYCTVRRSFPMGVKVSQRRLLLGQLNSLDANATAATRKHCPITMLQARIDQRDRFAYRSVGSTGRQLCSSVAAIR